MSKAVAFILRELREALPAFLFFLVAFHMIAATKAVLLESYHVSTAKAAAATVGALIVAKAILIVGKLPVAEAFAERRIYAALWRALLFGVVAMIFRVLEELIGAAIRAGGLGAALAEIRSGIDWPTFAIVHMWLFALLVLYCLAEAFVRALGKERAWAILLERRKGV